MSDQFLQVAVGATGTTTDSCTLTGVTAGSTIVAFLWRGDGSATVHTVADGQGSYTSRGPSAFDATNSVWVQAFSLENANSGSHVLTGTIDSGAACFIAAVEIGTSGTGTYSGGNSAAQSAPGTGTDGVSSGSATVSAAATLVAMGTDSGSTAPSDEPATGTGFTSRSNNANGFIGAYRIETKAVAANAAGTFTAITGFHNFVTAAVAILNPAAAGVALDDGSVWFPTEPQDAPLVVSVWG